MCICICWHRLNFSAFCHQSSKCCLPVRFNLLSNQQNHKISGHEPCSRSPCNSSYCELDSANIFTTRVAQCDHGMSHLFLSIYCHSFRQTVWLSSRSLNLYLLSFLRFTLFFFFSAKNIRSDNTLRTKNSCNNSSFYLFVEIHSNFVLPFLIICPSHRYDRLGKILLRKPGQSFNLLVNSFKAELVWFVREILLM